MRNIDKWTLLAHFNKNLLTDFTIPVLSGPPLNSQVKEFTGGSAQTLHFICFSSSFLEALTNFSRPAHSAGSVGEISHLYVPFQLLV